MTGVQTCALPICGGTIRAAARDAAYVAVICSLAWFVVVMAMYQAFLGTGRQHGVFLAEGDLDDFRQSFPSGGNFDAFMVDLRAETKGVLPQGLSS